MLLVAGAVVGVWLARRDDVGAPLDDTEWAARYCDTVTPYGDEASTQIRQLTLAATVPGGGAELKRLTTAFARLIDGVLAKIEQLSKDHPISDDGGADLTKQLQDALRDIRDKLATALSQVEKLDASAPDFATQAVAVLAASGISFDTRITMPQSAALNRLNVAITANAKCTSFFATG